MTTTQQDWQNFLSQQPWSDATRENIKEPYLGLLFDNNSADKENFPLSVLEVSGPDALKFLQGQLSCDMNLVNLQQAQAGACINLKGRIISNFLVLKWNKAQFDSSHADAEPSFLLLCVTDALDKTAAVLKKYAIFSKVRIEAPGSDVIISVTNNSEIKEKLSASQNDPNNCLQLCDFPETQRKLILTTSETALTIWQAFKNTNFLHGENFWKLSNIQDGIAFIDSSTSELFTPQEINFELIKGINFTKGCYTGQEVVARLHYRGQAKRRAFIAEIDYHQYQENEKVGSEIFNMEKKIGHLICNSHPVNGKSLALVSLTLESAERFINKENESTLTLSAYGNKISALAKPPYPLEKKI